MDGNKPISFEEFWPIFLFFIRHNKPWRQFEICTQRETMRPRSQKDRVVKQWKLGSTCFNQIWRIFLKWWSSPRELGVFSCRKWRPESGQTPRKICWISTPLSPQPVLRLPFPDIFLRLDSFIQHDRRFLHLQSQRRSANFSSLPGWYWVSCSM